MSYDHHDRCGPCDQCGTHLADSDQWPCLDCDRVLCDTCECPVIHLEACS